VLLTAAFYVEHNRANPLLNTRWVTSAAIVRLLVAMTLIRVVLSEQSIGAVGFLRAVGLNNDQMQTLFVVVLIGTIVGIVGGAIALAPTHLPQPVIVALILIAIGAWLDSHATSVTRPEQMYLSQFLLACGGALFLGPAVIALIGRVLPDPRNLISFSVMFSLTQNVGGLVGAAALGTFQVVREKYHSNVLVEHLTLLDPLVAARVQGGAGAVARLVQDPAARTAQGVAMLSAQATREANVLAYNDVFLVIAIAAVLILVWVSAVLLVLKYRNRPAAALPPPVPAKAEP
ncbi:MAG: MFS transporter, partial [Gemmatimonadaceae bacterium]|nr:MFS transporter [Gemmatimonadaceae bacterium]